MNYLLCCDLSTLNCSQEELEKLVSSFSYKHLKVSNNIWLFKCQKNEYACKLSSVPEYIIDNILDQVCDNNSVIFITEISSQKYYYSLPNSASDFLGPSD